MAGVASAAVALGVGELLAALVAPQAAPLVAVGGVVVDQVPESGKELAIRLFGTNDKLALQVGTVVLLAGFAALIGALAVDRLWVGYAGIALFGVVGVASAVTRPGATALWALPSALGAGAAAATLWYLLRRMPDPAPESSAEPGTPRRRFLGAAAAAVGAAALVGVGGRFLGQRSSVDAARDAVALPTPSGRPATLPAGADVAELSYITDNGSFYRIDTALVVPRIDPDAWTLKIHGRVGRPMTLTFADLLRRPMIERYVTLACVSNLVGGDLIGNARWLGVPVGDLLDEVAPDPAADQVVSRSVDGFTAGTPTAVLRDGRDAMIAIAMNGVPLPIEHGFPARIVIPGLYGYVSATKWVESLEFTKWDTRQAYWLSRGWAEQAPIKTQSRIDRPNARDTQRAGQVVVAGVAWAQHRGISRVEVRVDDGPWEAATLAETVGPDTWRQWSFAWDTSAAGEGEHRLSVRATDADGQVQTSDIAPPAPDGASGWHEIQVQVA